MPHWKSIGSRLIRPPWWLSVPLVLSAAALLVYVFVAGQKQTPLAYIAYAGSTYALAVTAAAIPGFARTIRSRIEAHPIGRKYLGNVVYRSTVSLYIGLTTNLLYAAFKLFTSWRYHSVWFGAIAVYYLLLGAIRLFLAGGVRRAAAQENSEQARIYALRRCRSCGYLMFGLNLAMAGMIVQMVWQNQAYHYPGYILYASAAYAFTSLTLSIIHWVRQRRMGNPLLYAIKTVGVAGSLMSLLALQTAMLAQFGGEDAVFRQVMNTTTGICVLVIVFLLTVRSVIRTTQQIQQIARE